MLLRQGPSSNDWVNASNPEYLYNSFDEPSMNILSSGEGVSLKDCSAISKVPSQIFYKFQETKLTYVDILWDVGIKGMPQSKFGFLSKL